MSRQVRTRALIQVGRDLGFVSPGETGTPLLDEVLREIGALDRPDWKDHYLSDLALALRSRRLTEAALQVIRMIQSPTTRSESAVNPEFLAEIDPASVQEALMAVTQIDNTDDREAMEDCVAQALAAIGRKEEALQFVVVAQDEFRRCWRELRVAEGFMECRDFAAALKHTGKAVEEFRGRFSGGLADSMYGDAAMLFARLGEFDRAADIAAAGDNRTGYVACKTRQVCKMMVDASRKEQALGLARSIPEVADAASALIAIAESRAQSGETEGTIALLDEVGNSLLEVLEREATRRRTAPDAAYISDRGSLEHRSATALNQVAGGYFRLGQTERAVKTAARQMPDGADRNLFSLQAADARGLALDAVQTDHPHAARVLLDYAFECARAIHLSLPYERAERLAGLVAPELIVEMPETAAQVWTTLEESSLDRTSLLNACIQIATDCGVLKARIPDTLSTAICEAVDET